LRARGVACCLSVERRGKSPPALRSYALRYPLYRLPFIHKYDTMSGTQNPITDQEGLGPAGNGKDLGFLCHPTLVTDPENRAVIGATGLHIWAREERTEGKAEKKKRHSGRKPLEEKESYRWAERAVAARETVRCARGNGGAGSGGGHL
jgi:hypothetical protein